MEADTDPEGAVLQLRPVIHFSKLVEMDHVENADALLKLLLDSFEKDD